MVMPHNFPYIWLAILFSFALLVPADSIQGAGKLHAQLMRRTTVAGEGSATTAANCKNNVLPAAWSQGGVHTCDGAYKDSRQCGHAAIKSACCHCGGGTPTGAPTEAPTEDVFITELADPSTDTKARYVELYSVAGQSLDGLRLVRWTNTNQDYTESTTIDLSQHTIAAGGFLIVCRDKTTFESTWPGVTCDVHGGGNGPADSNGDDQIAILDSSDAKIDIFGLPGETTRQHTHDFKDGRAERNAGVTEGKPTWSASDWTVKDHGSMTDCNPRVWIGQAPTDPTKATTSSPTAPHDASKCVNPHSATTQDLCCGLISRVSCSDGFTVTEGSPCRTDISWCQSNGCKSFTCTQAATPASTPTTAANQAETTQAVCGAASVTTGISARATQKCDVVTVIKTPGDYTTYSSACNTGGQCRYRYAGGPGGCATLVGIEASVDVDLAGLVDGTYKVILCNKGAWSTCPHQASYTFGVAGGKVAEPCQAPTTAPEETTSQACPQELEVSGAEERDPDKMGVYSVVSLTPSSSHSNKPIYANPHGAHLYFWAANGNWIMSATGYENDRGTIFSKSDTKCPAQAVGWLVWADGEWSSEDVITVADKR